jgi:twinkle protein
MTQRRLYHPPPQNAGGYVITPEMVIDFLDSHNVDTTLHRCTQTHVILRECPFCHKPSGGKADNLYKCYIRTNVPNSAYHCHRCGSGGSWYELKKRLGGFEVESLHQLAGRPQHRAMSTASAGGRGGSTAWRSSKFSVSAGTHPAATMRQPDYSKRAYEGYLRGPPPYSSPEQMARQIVPPLAVPSPHLQSLYTTTLLDAKTSRVRDYLVNERGLNLNTLRKYGVGQTSYRFPNEKNEWVSSDCVTFPWIMTVSQAENQEAVRGSHFVWTDKPSSTAKPNHDAKTKDSSTAQVSLKDSSFVTRRLKIRSIEEKSWQRMEPAGGGWGLFGWHTIPPDAKEVVITEGEYDAMAVYQATGRPAISLPNGCRSLPVEVLPMLDELEKIYLWMDNDAAGQEGAEAFAKKLGLERTYNVRPTPQNIVRVNQEEEESADNLQNVGTPKDANEALLNGLDLNRIIDGSQLVPHERIQTFQNLRTNVMHEILYPDKYTGTPIKSLPGLTSLMQGLRRGEMTVLTGPTGSGKTTFLGQVSIDLAESGMNVLWGSFEIKNTRLIHKLLQQFAREPLPKGDLSMEDKMEAIADRFERLPLHFLTFHGGSDVDQVLEAMDYAGRFSL